MRPRYKDLKPRGNISNSVSKIKEKMEKIPNKNSYHIE